MKVREYIQADGSSPYKDWFNSLDAQPAAKVATAKIRMEQGLTAAIKWFDGIGEYKIDWGPGYRIYLAKDGEELIVLFGGGTKKEQNKDIQRAKELYAEYKARKQVELEKRKKELIDQARAKGPSKKGKAKRNR